MRTVSVAAMPYGSRLAPRSLSLGRAQRGPEGGLAGMTGKSMATVIAQAYGRVKANGFNFHRFASKLAVQ